MVNGNTHKIDNATSLSEISTMVHINNNNNSNNNKYG